MNILTHTSSNKGVSVNDSSSNTYDDTLNTFTQDIIAEPHASFWEELLYYDINKEYQ